MNTDTFIKYEICKTQQMLYEYCANHRYDMKRFSVSYLTSGFCKRAMDQYSRFQISDPETILSYLLEEIEKPESFDYFDPDVAGWIGWMYRYIMLNTGIPSQTLCEKIPFANMCAYYKGLHTVNEDIAVDIISRDHLQNFI